jgi:NAD(P)H-hydrate epimerase
MGEFAFLVNKSRAEVALNTIHHLQDLVSQLSCTVVLKGPCTFIGIPTGKIYVHHSPNDGMAKGGSGDVLAGIVGGLLGQQASHLHQDRSPQMSMDEWQQNILLGIFLHSRAGHHAAKREGTRSMTALSILEGLPEAFKEFESGH